MASTRAQQGALLKDQTFLNQVTGSLNAMAYLVVMEAGTVANHANRVLYANAILVNPAAEALQILPGVMASAAVLAAAGTPASILDSDVDTRVVLVFNYYANQYVASAPSSAPLVLGG